MRVLAYLFLMADRYPPFTLADDPGYPVRLRIAYPEHGVDRWRPFVHWLLAIPYLLAGSVLFSLSQVLAFFALFTILFTKEFPKGLFDMAEIGMRWYIRGQAYSLWLVTRYPPFVWG
jgi:hypothetical protein